MKLYIAFFILALLPCAYALKTGVVVDVEGDIYKGCVEVSKGDSVYNLLSKFDKKEDDIKMGIDGILTHMYFLRSVNDIEGKCSGNSCSGWNFWVSDNDDDFKEPPELAPGWGMGIGDYKIKKSSEVIGINFGTTEYNPDFSVKVKPQKPGYVPYSELCEILSIEEINFKVDGKKEVGILNAEPGSELAVKIKIENIGDYTKLQGVNVEAAIEGIDGGEDMAQDFTDFDLRQKDSKVIEFKFQMPFDAEEDDYTIRIKSDGKDEHGIEYNVEKTFTVRIKRGKHEIVFRNVGISKNELNCNEQANLNLEIANNGKEDETGTIRIASPQLGIGISDKFALASGASEEENKLSKTYKIKIPNSQKEGDYELSIKAEYSGKIIERAVPLKVVCKKTERSKKPVIPTENKQEPPAALETALPIEDKKEGKSAFPTAILALEGIAILICIVAIAKMVV